MVKAIRKIVFCSNIRIYFSSKAFMVIVNVIRMSVSWAVRPWSHGRKTRSFCLTIRGHLQWKKCLAVVRQITTVLRHLSLCLVYWKPSWHNLLMYFYVIDPTRYRLQICHVTDCKNFTSVVWIHYNASFLMSRSLYHITEYQLLFSIKFQ